MPPLVSVSSSTNRTKEPTGPWMLLCCGHGPGICGGGFVTSASVAYAGCGGIRERNTSVDRTEDTVRGGSTRVKASFEIVGGYQNITNKAQVEINSMVSFSS